jgi:hypothetical protein
LIVRAAEIPAAPAPMTMTSWITDPHAGPAKPMAPDIAVAPAPISAERRDRFVFLMAVLHLFTRVRWRSRWDLFCRAESKTINEHL